MATPINWCDPGPAYRDSTPSPPITQQLTTNKPLHQINIKNTNLTSPGSHRHPEQVTMPNLESVSFVRKTITRPTYASETPVLTHQAGSSVNSLRGKASPNHAESQQENRVPPLSYPSPSRSIRFAHHAAQATFHNIRQITGLC